MTEHTGFRGSEEKTDRNMAIMVALAKPKATVAGVAKEFEISPKRVRDIRDKEQGRIGELQDAKNEDLIAKLGDLQMRVLHRIDDEALEAASVKDLMIVFGIATEKRELLAGRPTARMSIEDRRSREEIAKALLAELGRRGIAAPAPQVELQPAEFVEVAG